ncbi:hypothetical protein [Streptomyces roseolilacinus]|uniref:Uncharacterized protein n=1 Tax=Streptomyces roseolilacinus TaxID=66904 RepID=A0A918B165_9ACTN|nr:hypothetical protein [Streptomyces roseolilacinus]GGQ12387.1 hypothetical protein GCM10010249_33790 [Streptomyces roseolilacinus]
MSTLTLAELNTPLLALRLFSAEFAHLPAPCVSVSTVYPDRLDLTFHDNLAAFEAWRAALGIAPEAVSYREQGDHTRVLTTDTTYAGAHLHLVGFGRLTPAPVDGA